MSNAAPHIRDASQQHNNGCTGEIVEHIIHPGFEEQYLSLRLKENRIYGDAELARLPHVREDHPYYKEWLFRKKSSGKLADYLQKKKQTLEILEVGCGNGWLTNRLAVNSNLQATGIDINRVEIEQAIRVFKVNTNCRFFYADIYSEPVNHKKFDIIIFAASLQYFSSVQDILGVASALLKRGGEIHILDTHLYKADEVEAARQRSVAYFKSVGHPEMSSRYFHHSMDDLKNFAPTILFDPYSFRNKFLTPGAPFFWLCIKNINP